MPFSHLGCSSCDPKGGGKHEGKFYVKTGTRTLKLVAPDAPTMTQWVEAINAARVEVHTLPSGKSGKLSAEMFAEDDAGGSTSDDVDHGEAVQRWQAAVASGDGALADLAGELQLQVANEFASVISTGDGDDVEGVIEVAEHVAELMCGVLDESVSFEGGGHGPMFSWFLNRYHGLIFTHLGGYFLDSDGLEPSDALALCAWVGGYHVQLSRFGLDTSSLVPSLEDAAAELIESSAIRFADRVERMANDEAFVPQLSIARSKSGSGAASMSRSSAYGGALELPVYLLVVDHLQSLSDGLRGEAGQELSDMLLNVTKHLRPVLTTVHTRLGDAVDAARAKEHGAEGAAELLATALNSLWVLSMTLRHFADVQLSSMASAELHELTADIDRHVSATTAWISAHLVQEPSVVRAAQASTLFPTPHWWAGQSGRESNTSDGVQALMLAVDNELRTLAAASLPGLVPGLERAAKAATLQIYLQQLLCVSSGKLDSAPQSLARDAFALGSWCASSQPVEVSDGEREAPDKLFANICRSDAQTSTAIDALDSLRQLISVDVHTFADVWSAVVSRHPDAPLALAEVVISRRSDLVKAKKTLVATCQKAREAASENRLAETRVDACVFSWALASKAASPSLRGAKAARWPF